MIGMMLIMAIANCITMAIALVKSNEIINGFGMAYQGFKRQSKLDETKMQNRELVNIANGFSPEKSIVLVDRYQFYIQHISTEIEYLRKSQQILDTYNSDFTEQYSNVTIRYLGENLKITKKIKAMSYSINLYVAKQVQFL